MQRTAVELATVVDTIVCDRCGEEASRHGLGFSLMTSIGFLAGYASHFGDGNRVEIDLCEPCLRDTLGTWVRVTTPADATTLSRMLEEFQPEVHGGEFPTRELQRRGDLADPPHTAPDRTMHGPSGCPDLRPPAWLVALVERIVQESGDPVDFDAVKWTTEWLEEANPALGGRKPAEFLDSGEGCAIVRGLVLRMQSGA
jgi:hypothetical protein